ncbi:hypothetical protein WB388_08695 [Streptomyces brasiliscabiei]|uniref:Uncharacterized protein n=1 Tax=Streptomyces brasiliscabiei TaxID=2736302 RepID=A0ABU8G9U1_9ACTN
MTNRTDPVGTALHTYLDRQLLARQALDHDPRYRAHVEWLRQTLTALHDAMDAEDVPPPIRDRIVHRVLYGSAPDESEAMARVAERQRAFAEISRLDAAPYERMIPMSSQRVPVRVLLLLGDKAEIVADVPPEERAEPIRYPAAEIADAVGVPAAELPGKRLTADVGEGDRLSGWRLA